MAAKAASAAILTLGVLLAGQELRGEKYALLIGIGAYESPINKLHGPAQDVSALTELLTTQGGFRPGNVSTLVDGEATRKAILDAIDALVARVHPGDYVFLYYSGHGTGPGDLSMAKVVGSGLTAFTGALLPVDLHPGTAEETLGQLIIGLRDLRPRLSKLDNVATVFAVFDACYSGDSIKAVGGTEWPGRSVPFWKLLRNGTAPQAAPGKDAHIPMRAAAGRQNHRILITPSRISRQPAATRLRSIFGARVPCLRSTDNRMEPSRTISSRV